MDVPKQLLITGIGVCITLSIAAQNSNLIKIKSEKEIEKQVAFTDRYRLPAFQEGTVSFLTGGNSKAKLNYNLLLGEMHFIAPNSDTLSLSNEYLIKNIQIHDIVFYYNPDIGYVEVMLDTPAAKLGVKQVFRIASLEKQGAYQQSSGAGSIRNYSVFSHGNGSVQKLETKGDIVFSKTKTYFFIDTNNRFYKASKSSISKIFPKHKSTIEKYLKEHPIDVYDEDNLKNLLQFCNQLL